MCAAKDVTLLLMIDINNVVLFFFINQFEDTETQNHFRVTWDISTSICTQERESILVVLTLQLKGLAEFLKQNTNFQYVKISLFPIP